MRHNRRAKRFGRSLGERRAMLENMVSSLISHQQITTTLEKAKEAKRLADRVIHLGKTDSLHARRMVFSYLQDHELTARLFKEVSPRFKSRSGGYTRILQLSRRKGDGAQLALLELTEKEIKVKTPLKKKKKQADAQGHDHDKHEHGHEHGHEHEKGHEKGHAKTEPGKPKQQPKTGFLKNIGKLFRKQGGNG